MQHPEPFNQIQDIKIHIKILFFSICQGNHLFHAHYDIHPHHFPSTFFPSTRVESTIFPNSFLKGSVPPPQSPPLFPKPFFGTFLFVTQKRKIPREGLVKSDGGAPSHKAIAGQIREEKKNLSSKGLSPALTTDFPWEQRITQSRQTIYVVCRL